MNERRPRLADVTDRADARAGEVAFDWKMDGARIQVHKQDGLVRIFTSSRYPGGLALRLARVKRYRTGKRVEDADTMDTMRKLFTMQSGP